ncbi:hypothetical protein [Microbacterium sp. HJ5]
MDADPDFARALNAVLMGIVVLAFVVTAVATATTSSASARADRFSQGVRLPYGSPRIRESVVWRMRASARASGWTLVVAALLGSTLLLTPLATTPYFPFLALWPVLVAAGVVGAVVNLRERLFHPAPDAIRIARSRAMRSADYLDPFRRGLTWLLAGAAAASLAALAFAAASRPLDGTLTVAAVCAGFLAALLCGTLPALERLVLNRPQPATHTLELAWDDAFRTAAISALRLSAAHSVWLVVAFAMAAALSEASEPLLHPFAQQLPLFGLLALQFVYPVNGRRLRPDLYPDWLRHAAPAGGPA